MEDEGLFKKIMEDDGRLNIMRLRGASTKKKAEIEKRGYNIKQCAPQPSHTTPISIGIDYI